MGRAIQMEKKKPTMKEMVKVVANLINEKQILLQRLANLEFLVDCYFEFKDEKGDVQKYVKDRIDKINKDRASNSSSDNG